MKRIAIVNDEVAETPLVAKEEAQAITNPILEFEIISKTTEQYDRKQQFLEYRSLPSFKEYVLVRQDTPEVLTFCKVKHNMWQEEEFVGLEGTVPLQSLGIELKLGDIYRRVEF